MDVVNSFMYGSVERNESTSNNFGKLFYFVFLPYHFNNYFISYYYWIGRSAMDFHKIN